jgi:putative sterol carrier protein
MDVKTPSEFFDKVLPEKFDPSKAKGFDAVIQMNISGASGGEWTVTLEDGRLNVSKSRSDHPTMAISMSDSDFVDLVNGEMSGQRAFMSGKLKFEGDFSVALRLLQSGIL